MSKVWYQQGLSIYLQLEAVYVNKPFGIVVPLNHFEMIHVTLHSYIRFNQIRFIYLQENLIYVTTLTAAIFAACKADLGDLVYTCICKS